MHPRRWPTVLVATLTATLIGPGFAQAVPRETEKHAVAVGRGGAVSSVDPEATQIGIEVLRDGGNAVDAAVAVAAALGVTEPFSAGIGGGGFFVYYDAASGEVSTIDGRETAPASMPSDAFINPATGEPYNFSPELVTSGVSVGVPGTPATWAEALDRWGTMSLGDALRRPTQVARRGFVVDPTFRAQIRDNAERFAAFVPTREMFLPAPQVGSVFRNRDLAATYRLIAQQGSDAFYTGPLAQEIVDVVRKPPVTSGTDLPAPPGFMTPSDLAAYEVVDRAPTHVDYRGLDIYGMRPPSSGGSTVGEALNILEGADLGALSATQVQHRVIEASALAFADRNAYVGDPAYVDVPLEELLSDGFAAERACHIEPDSALKKPVEAGKPDGSYETSCDAVADLPHRSGREGTSTTHLSVVDQWGNAVAYTLTIEQIGGSGIVVPDRGFLLNNELTDFSPEPSKGDPNVIAGGKRPRSSMAPTIVVRDGEAWLVLGSPGGPTIITTVLGLIVNRVDRGMSLPQAVAAPRATQLNSEETYAEPAFLDRYGSGLRALGQRIVDASAVDLTEIGAVAAIEIRSDGTLVAAAEPQRRGRGDARVVREVGDVPGGAVDAGFGPIAGTESNDDVAAPILLLLAGLAAAALGLVTLRRRQEG